MKRQNLILAKIKRGFTLAEILIVIAIISILVVGTTLAFKKSLQNARNTQRKNDLKQYRLALETYANNKNSLYPPYYEAYSNGITSVDILCNYLEVTYCPQDPLGPRNGNRYDWYYYKYSTSSDYIKYVLYAGLEPQTKIWVICSNGKSGEIPATSRWTIFPDGECPL